MNRTVAIYGVLLVASLIGAYLSWTHEAEDQDRGVVLFDIEPEELASLTYTEGEKFEIRLEPRSDEYGDYVWVQSTRTEAKKPPRNPHGPPPETEPDAPAETVSRSFKAGSAVDRTMDTVAPFAAIRQIEDTEGRMGEFGLDEPRATLEIEGPSKTRSFAIGEAGYGHRNIYVMDRETESVYLVDGRAIGALKRGDERLPERRLFEGNAPDVEKATIYSGSESVSVVHKNRSDRTRAFWAREKSQERDRSAAAWIRKALRLRSTSYAPTDFDATGLETALTLELELADGKTPRIELMRGQDAEGREQWYGRSDLTRGIVELPMATASDLARDVGTVLGTKGDESENLPPADEAAPDEYP